MLLHNLNPAIKALTVIVCILILSIFFDPVTPLISITFTILVTLLLGKVSWKRWLLLFSPFLFFAIVYIWSSMWFAEVEAGDTILWQWGFLTMTDSGLETAISLGLRVLSFSVLSLLFVLTTKPVDFILSLMQQCKLPPKLAYGIMAGYRFLPLIREEFSIIRSAHRIRGVKQKTASLPERIRNLKRYIIPLLAGAIRKAERTALAMESKGFTGEGDRTFYRRFHVSGKDWLFLFLMVSGILMSVFVSWSLGTLGLYQKEL
ncbi:energy-coupling factor transporter transmembrane protein EcfT [Rossellomorea vietnamensis]|uniref:Energy-coupling factor transporter transmembrane protein EcfT n=1 Tax=Rossellomorea vietnamensis TaxID=218284 RepID=A0A5D4M237_9BACI|nr:energy-coupling factor transporter transmembrane protein EcfT [Rossellomorea vietnamensis]